MRQKRSIDIDLPWPANVIILFIAVLVSIAVLSIVLLAFEAVIKNAVSQMFQPLGALAPLLPDLGPLKCAFFILGLPVLSVRVFLALRKRLARNLTCLP